MNNTPTPRERFRKILDISTGVSELLADSNASYIHWLEKELTAVTEQLKKTQKHLKDANRGAEINAHALRINADKLIAVTEQRDRLAEAIITHRAKAWPLTGEQFDQDLWDTLAAVKGGADE